MFRSLQRSGSLLSIFIAAGILFYFTALDPFFGDAITSTSRPAQLIFSQHLAGIFYPVDADPGHPTLFPWLMALFWTIFGKSLLVSHFFGIAWFLGAILFFRKLAEIFLKETVAVNRATLLSLILPVLLSQGAMMLPNIALTTFFLSSLYGLFARRKLWLFVSLSLMMLTHLQSLFILPAIALIDLLVVRRGTILSWLKSRLWIYAVPAFLFAAWLIIHYHHTGWFLSSPFYSDRGSINSPIEVGKKLLLITWRLVDYGMLPLYLVAILGILSNKSFWILAKSWAILAIVFCLALAVVSQESFAHRYFLGLNLLIILVASAVVEKQSPRRKNIGWAFLFICLLGGNFLYYPGKTIGDATLAYRRYFVIEQNINQDFGTSVLFYSYAPIANPPYLKYLDSSGLKIERIESQPLTSLPAVIESNVNAEFTTTDKEFLAKTFYGKSYENGPVYANVFLNPAFYSKPPGWKLREPSAIESLILKWKAKLKR